MLQTM
jgi:hypothetical protein